MKERMRENTFVTFSMGQLGAPFSMIARSVYKKACENFIETSTHVLFYLMLKVSMFIRGGKKKTQLLEISVLGSQLRLLRCLNI